MRVFGKSYTGANQGYEWISESFETDSIDKLSAQLVYTDATGSPLSFDDGDVNNGADTITIVGHGLSTGTLVTYDVVSGNTLTGLVDGDPYAVIVVDDDTIQLAANQENAAAGTEIAIATDGTASYTLTATTVAGEWNIEGSNDGVNWTSQAVTNDITTGALIQGALDVSVRKIRSRVTVTGGAIDGTVYFNGKRG